MTRQETGIIMDILTTAYPRFYSGPDAPDPQRTVNLWAEMFAGDDVALVAAAVKSYIVSDIKGYPPHIGAIKNAMLRLSQAGELNAAEAWSLVRRAASRSAYGAQEEFDRLPEQVRRMVGSPSQLYEWSQMDTEVVGSVVASNFQRSWRARQVSRRQDALLPPDVKAVLEGLGRPWAAGPAVGRRPMTVLGPAADRDPVADRPQDGQ